MAIRPGSRPGQKPLSSADFADYLLSIVRPLERDEILRNALRAQLAAPHIARFEVRLIEGDALVVAAGASRRLEARRAAAARSLPATEPLLGGALSAEGAELVPASAAGVLAPPEGTTRVALAPFREGEHVRGLALSCWSHPESAPLDERLLARESMLAGHLGVALAHADSIATLRSAGSAPGEPAGGKQVLRDDEIRALEERNLLAALEASGGKVSGPGGAAERLGINASTLASRLRALGLARGVWSRSRS